MGLSSPGPKVFFDTQICINSANQVIPEDDWRLVAQYLARSSEYYVSPLTVVELLASLAKGNAQFFQKNRGRLRRVYEPGQNARFFDFIRFFVADTVFGIPLSRPANLEDDFATVIKIILTASSAKELAKGVVGFPGQPRIYLGGFLEQLEDIQHAYIADLTGLQGRARANIRETEWSTNALKFLQIPFSVERQTKLVTALSAAYHFEMTLLGLVRNSNYNLRKNVSDLIDGQQLYYLCDPTVVFITDDSDHKKRLKEAAQRERIKTWSELLAHAKRGAPLT